MKRPHFFVALTVVLIAGACTPMERDIYVTATSQLGVTFTVPSQWTTTDEGNTFSLESPDNHAAIHAVMFTAAGSGSLTECGDTILPGFLPKEAKQWADSKWQPITIGTLPAMKRELVSVPATDHKWVLYVADGGEFYHAIILHGSKRAMDLNGPYYESLVLTFEHSDENP
ncbi:hypothetical protein ETAA8_50280 [Anatilimnocola aggregata]|uniref:Lipoprotein n=1 Tax=Anatilimnocola aggregata TaxID=2528021 RepID=A0A517YI80_9BACT|nr:hypothetical protein [Anatilimnocola aggregata]QDU29911.1 hypothetical protein ETAA8_50280 [Anatilimnocola aggregata]